jgi:hypothetical protein
MAQTYNIYCDESCHLQHDGQKVMVLGGLSCPADATREIALKVRALKRKHGLADAMEIKWVKVSPAQLSFYLDLVDLFFTEDRLSFRGLVVPNKSLLRHKDFDQTHDNWYYKMYYLLLRPMLRKDDAFKIYLDIKDTRGQQRVRELKTFLRNAVHDPRGQIVAEIQQVRSHEVASIQIADLLIGALSYFHRELDTSPAKLSLIGRIKSRSNLTLKWSTAPGRKKFDLFIWDANQEDAT